MSILLPTIILLIAMTGSNTHRFLGGKSSSSSTSMAHAFALSPPLTHVGNLNKLNTLTPSTILSLSNSPQQPRQPRRMLKKRRSRQQRDQNLKTPAQEFPWETTESRPLVKSVSREAGTDYWMDEKDLEMERNRKLELEKRRRQFSQKGEAVKEEKLWNEVKAPYRQNWIGYFSVFVAILSIIIIQFPELLDQPAIPIPDL